MQRLKWPYAIEEHESLLLFALYCSKGAPKNGTLSLAAGFVEACMFLKWLLLVL